MITGINLVEDYFQTKRKVNMGFLRNLFGKAQKEIPPLSDEEKEQAKKIFFEYRCNEFYMAREGEDFAKYRISEEQKAEWRKEFITEWKNQLSTDDLTALQKLHDAEAFEAVPDLIAMIDKGDSFAKLEIVRALWTMSRKIADKTMRKRTVDSARNTLQFILDNPVQVSEEHKIHIRQLLKESPEEYIIPMAKQLLKEVK
jgi:hypothetical protein